MQFLREKIAAARSEPQKLVSAGFLLALAAAMVIGFAQLRVPGGGDDWITFADHARRMVGLMPGPLYDPTQSPDTRLFNPPWLLMVGLPIFLLPNAWGWAVCCTASLFLGVLVLRRWVRQPGVLKIAMLTLSPPMIYILLHGQIDMLVLAGLLLPVDIWWLLALTKPQNVIGLAFGVPVPKWLRAGLIVAGVLILTLILFGNWPLALTHQGAGSLIYVEHNLWKGLWPFQLAAGVGLLGLGISRKDERFLVSASPFLSPYVAMSSMIGPWIAALTGLNDWQAGLVFATWWGAVIFRALGGTGL